MRPAADRYPRAERDLGWPRRTHSRHESLLLTAHTVYKEALYARGTTVIGAHFSMVTIKLIAQFAPSNLSR